MLNKLVPAGLKKYIRHKSGVPDIFISIERLKRLGFQPRHIVDVGAYEGEWTKNCMQIFPEAHFLMVEAMEKKRSQLDAFIRQHPNVKLAIELLGAESGKEVYFSEIETASSVLEEASTSHERNKRKIATLNEVIEQQAIQKVDFLKLDVQGYELEVLKGFGRYLSETDVILSEVSLLDIHKNVPLIKDVLDFMYGYGFVVYDICSVSTRRPLDNALWQTDLMFVKEDSRFRKDKRYAA